jgi:hypothetical protein
MPRALLLLQAGEPYLVGNTQVAGHLMDSKLKELLPALPVIYVKVRTSVDTMAASRRVTDPAALASDMVMCVSVTGGASAAVVGAFLRGLPQAHGRPLRKPGGCSRCVPRQRKLA